ncbi:hypothetical protein [Promicromonospora sukumoe]|uniref:Uncharacterized protein n=1 Tax=Promicromonospora sukumoe TaxID=88382 RepID=A0A7W3JDT0_9MICO|nr:hypothetical protein [Promicromonospora sukumoe]MBA8810983.1 hypothetical protein [Promicromonospora sukumoe]
MNPRSTRTLTVPAALVMLVAALLGLIGPTTASAAPRSAPAAVATTADGEGSADAAEPAPAAPVVVVGVAGLRWTDVSRSTTPTLWHMIGGGSVASINVRTAAPATCPLDAWLTLSAGSRTVSAGSAERADRPDPEQQDGEEREARGAASCTPVPEPATGSAQGSGDAEPARATVDGWAQLPEKDEDEDEPVTEPAARAKAPAPGLLGEMLAEADACSTAIGPGAAVMLAREDGTVGRYVPSLDALTTDGAEGSASVFGARGQAWQDALTECPVTVVDAGSLPEGPERAQALKTLDGTLASLTRSLLAGTRVLVAGVADTPLTQQGLQVVVDWVVDVPRVRWLTSEASRSTGFVQLTDLTATAAEAAGALPDPEAEELAPEPALEEPSIDGMPIEVGEPRRTTVARTVENRQYINVLADTIPAQVPAFIGAIVLFLLIAVLVLVLPRRAARPRREPGPYRQRLALGAALLAVSAPAAASLATLSRWWVWPAPEFGLALSLTVAAVAVALTVRGVSRLLPAAPWRNAVAAAGITWLVFTVDGVTGFTLLQGSLLGPSLATADRFYGFSDVAFVVYAVSGLVLAGGLAAYAGRRRTGTSAGSLLGDGARGRDTPRPTRPAWLAVGAVVLVALVTVGVDAAPFFGDRLRGLALFVPFALLGAFAARPDLVTRFLGARGWLPSGRHTEPVRRVPSAVLGLSGALLLSLLFAAAVLPVAGAEAAGQESGSLSSGQPVVPPGDDVIVIGTQGLRWTDVKPSLDTGTAPAPTLYGLLTDGADAAGLTLPNGRAARCPDSGWLSLSSGRLAEVADERDADRHWICDDITVTPVTADAAADGDAASGADAGGDAAADGAVAEPAAPGDVTAQGDRPAVVDQWDRLTALQRGSGYAAHPGTFGDALAGECTTAVGPGAAVALAQGDGSVGRYFDLNDAVAEDSGAWDCPVTFVDAGSALLDVAERADLEKQPDGAEQVEAIRADLVAAVDLTVWRVLDAAPADTTVLVIDVATTPEHALELGPALLRPSASYDGLPRYLASTATRTEGVARLMDVPAAVLDAVGADLPADIDPTPLLRGGERPASAWLTADELADMTARDHVRRDAYIWLVDVPFWLGLALAAACWLVPRRIAVVPNRLRRAAEVAATALTALPAGGFLVSLTGWWRFDLPVLAIIGATVLVTAAVTGLSLLAPRRPLWAAPAVVAGITFVALTVDALFGTPLNRAAPLGSAPTFGARFYGFGNPTFSVYAVAAIALAAALAQLLVSRGKRVMATLAVSVVGVIAMAVDVWPTLGADLGGGLVLVPAFVVVGMAASGLRLTLWRFTWVAAAGVGVVALVGVLDWLRPPESRSHLGRFVGQVIDGEAVSTVLRKALYAVGSITGGPAVWATVAILVVVGLALLGPTSWRARLTPAWFTRADKEWEFLRPALVAMWVMAVLGSLVNDFGLRIAMIALIPAVPLLTMVALRTNSARQPR